MEVIEHAGKTSHILLLMIIPLQKIPSKTPNKDESATRNRMPSWQKKRRVRVTQTAHRN